MQNFKLGFVFLIMNAQVWAIKSDQQQKITVDGGGCVMRPQDNNTECPNGIVIKQGTMVIRGAYGLIYHEKKGVQKIKMSGSPVHFEQTMDSGDLLVIKAKQMDYIKADEKIYLKGDVNIVSEIGLTKGEEMEIDLLTQEISSVSEDPDHRFYMEIEPSNDNN